ncbi:hypothetical protein K438DRAFT_1760937 [Mycena galopus ATCC 62051]|nr:hypothetical protein K438DRAFT_1760937 [Mycena galopus ATCC 62051]
MGIIPAHVFPPKFHPERDMPDLSGKVIIVTGGNTGIGYETAKQLLLKNAKVYLAARSPDRASAAIKRLEEEIQKSPIFLQLDLADLTSVRKASDTFLSQESRLDILFNNECVPVPCAPEIKLILWKAECHDLPPDQVTAQEYDLRERIGVVIYFIKLVAGFGTNVIGHFLFTDSRIYQSESLGIKPQQIKQLPTLTKSYDEAKVPARVLNTSSIVHKNAPGNGIELVSVKGGPERDAWVKKKGNLMVRFPLYGQSKMGNILISNYFAKAHSAVLVECAVHPGPIHTELSRHPAAGLPAIGNLFAYLVPCASRFR